MSVLTFEKIAFQRKKELKFNKTTLKKKFIYSFFNGCPVEGLGDNGLISFLNSDDYFYIEILQVICQLLHRINKGHVWLENKHCDSAPFVQEICGLQVLICWPAVMKTLNYLYKLMPAKQSANKHFQAEERERESFL